MTVRLSLILVALAACGSASGAADRLVTLDDIDAYNDVGRPYLSADGRLVAYVSEERIFVVDTRGGAARPVSSTESKAWSPHWSVDGTSLFFLSDRSGTAQLWKLSLDTTGEAMQVTDLEFAIDELQFSPDDTRLLLRHRVPAKSEATEGTSAPWVINRMQFKEDSGDGYITDDEPNHYYVYSFDDKSIRPITAGRYDESEAAWSPDGHSIVFVSNREADPDISYRTDLWVTTLEDLGNGREPQRLTNSEHTRQAPAFSPDGRDVAYITAEDGVYGIQQLALVSAAGGEPRLISEKLDRWVSSFYWSGDGRWIYVQYDDAGGVYLARINVKSGKIEPLLADDNVVSGFVVDDGGRIVARLSTTNTTADLYVIEGSRKRALTAVNREYFSQLRLGAKHKITFESADGTLVDAFVTTPPDFDRGKTYPTILNIHGGPVGQFTYEYGFAAQYFAAQGYVVVEPNPRGSTGRGQAFINAIYASWGISDYEDILAAVDHTIREGYSDPERLAVTGYSYGGYMANVVITRSHRFKAAASGAGESLIAANYGHDIYQKWYNWELGPPWESPEKYARLSPLLQVANVTTPTIFLGGRDDWNVPVLNSELFYQSLKQRGIPTRLVVYPDSHHGDWPAAFNKDYLLRIHKWFDNYLGLNGDE